MPANTKMMTFSNALIHWYLQNKRDLPWRHTTSPYHIWLSEIMLQQTRVAQGMPYYFAFIETFPTVFDLANADEQKVLKLWQGLGYYSRARNLHKTAQQVAVEFNGVFPNTYKKLLKLKGVGEYTAAAIASFCYNEPVPVVDGNVFRVLARYFDIDTDIASENAKKEFASLASELMPKDNPAIFNQAIMEFGALQCVPKNPVCSVCPLNDGCFALKYNKVNQLPVKTKKQKAKNRFFNYLIVDDESNNTMVQKRSDKGIWHNLFEFPLIETLQEEDIDVLNHIVPFDNEIMSVKPINHYSIVHKLTHQHLHIKFWKVNVKGNVTGGISPQNMMHLPFPIVLFNFIEKHWQ